MARLKPALLLAALALLPAAKRAPPAPPPPVSAPPPPSIKLGVEKWRTGDYPGAVAMWTPFAAAGDPDAMFNMGQAYKLGRGVTADTATARDYYRRAAAKGHLPAQANLGIALFQAGEKPEAIKWLKTAADRGEARAQYVLGIATFNGDGVSRSQSVGYAYLLRAQVSGLPQAATALATIAPGLSPADRTAGESIAASLAAGGGVPALAAAAPKPTNTAALPPKPAATAALPPKPAATAALPPKPAATAMLAPSPVRVTSPGDPVPPKTTAAPVAATTGKDAAVAPAPLPPVSAPAPPRPVAEPTPAQADVAAKAAPAVAGTIATVAVPASTPPASLPRTSTEQRTSNVVPVKPPVAAPRPAAVALKPFETVVTPAKKPDGWRVQLGAFSSRKLADAAWADVKADAAPAKPMFATDGPVTKLQMGPFASREAAKAACTKLTAVGRACFVTQG